jgi:SAM-dependent methyltransferase
VPRGTATGVDVWRTLDQSGNDPEVTRRNAEREGVADRIELFTADIRAIPLPDDSFDVVASSLAIHNLPDATARDEVIDEAVRVMRAGGTLFIADIRATSAYAERLRHHGMADVRTRDLGWRFRYGSPSSPPNSSQPENRHSRTDPGPADTASGLDMPRLRKPQQAARTTRADHLALKRLPAEPRSSQAGAAQPGPPTPVTLIGQDDDEGRKPTGHETRCRTVR